MTSSATDVTEQVVGKYVQTQTGRLAMGYNSHMLNKSEAASASVTYAMEA